jgi:prepilin-type N-terminal cleavage/methylation domain-containing protein
MRNGFSFVEVLISVVILSMVGMALLKFNAFNKHIMQKSIRSFENNLINSPLLYIKNLDNYSVSEDFNLYDITAFSNLNDADRKFLKNTHFTLTVTEGEKIFLFNDQKQSRYLQAYNLYIQYKESKTNYLLIKEGK